MFATNYAVVSEMVVTDIEPSTTNIPIREAFGYDQILSDYRINILADYQ